LIPEVGLYAISEADVKSLIPNTEFGRMLSSATNWLENINEKAQELRDWVISAYSGDI